MKNNLSLLITFLGLIFITGISCTKSCSSTKNGADTKAQEISLETDAEKSAYAIGQQIGQQLKMQDAEIDVDALAFSIKEALEGKESRLSQEEMQQAFINMRAQAQKSKAKKAEKNKEEGDKYLEKNKEKEGMNTTESGLQYRIIEKGEGKSPTADSMVKVHYRGTLIDGTEFDSSYKRDEPATFKVNAVIKGWTEALQLMKEGAKWEITIPSDLAYGPQGRPGIPPNSVLNFEVELLEILDNNKDKKKESAK